MKKTPRQAGDSIHSMISMLPTLPALLHHIGRPSAPNRLSLARLVIVIVAGWLHAASMAWPFDTGIGIQAGQPVWWLQLLAIGLLAGQLDAQVHRRSIKRAAWLGGVFATVMLCSTFWWLYISMHTYGGLAAPLAAGAVVLLGGFLALYYAAASAAFVWLAPAARWQRAAVLAAMWLLAELARVQWFTGFPWGQGGYAHVDGWARPLAAWVGVHGITFLAAFLAAWLVMSLRAARRQWAVPVSLILLSIALAWLPVQSGLQLQNGVPVPGKLGVTLLQGNIPQNEKFELGTGIATSLAWYRDQLLAAQTALVVAPETAIPVLPQQLPDGYLTPLKTRFGTGQQAALIGMPLGDSDVGYANSVIGIKPFKPAGPGMALPPGAAVNNTAGLYRYDKHHLVPFGEFIPPGFRWFTNLMNIPLGDFNRGTVGQASFDWQGQRLALNICYEDLFGEELAARFTDASTAPTMFVNVSNIAWFGNSIAIDQHLQISRMRALEFSRPMLRATNTGATVIIDHRGQVTQSLERHTRGVLTGEAEGRSTITPYAWWAARYGLWPWWLLGLGIAGAALLLRQR